MTLDGGTISTALWTTFTDGSLVVDAGVPTFNLLTDFDGSSVSVYNGANVTLTALTSYTAGGGGSYYQFFAEGTGSTISLPSLTTFGAFKNTLYIQAEYGGHTLLPALTSISSASPNVQIQSTETGSLLSMPALVSWSGQGGNAGSRSPTAAP